MSELVYLSMQAFDTGHAPRLLKGVAPYPLLVRYLDEAIVNAV